MRSLLLYFACWLPFAACYSLILFLSGRPMRVADALVGGTTNTAVAALLGMPLMALVKSGLARRWPVVRLTVVSIAALIVYAVAWTIFVSLSVIRFAPPDAVAMYLKWGMWWQFVTGLLLGSAVVGASAFLHNARRLREQEARAAQAESLRARAELAALRAQLQPHFLFNALHSIAATQRADPRAAEEALEQLGSMLRYALGVQRDDREEVALSEELQFVRAYLAIEQLRLGDRLHIEERIDGDALECGILAFTVQPIVENAVRHGIAAAARGGTVAIAASIDAETLRIEVRDDGAGASSVAPGGDDRGVGIRAVTQRLTARYGSAASLRIDTAPGRGFRVSISIPVSVPAVARRVDPARMPIPVPLVSA